MMARVDDIQRAEASPGCRGLCRPGSAGRLAGGSAPAPSCAGGPCHPTIVTASEGHPRCTSRATSCQSTWSATAWATGQVRPRPVSRLTPEACRAEVSHRCPRVAVPAIIWLILSPSGHGLLTRRATSFHPACRTPLPAHRGSNRQLRRTYIWSRASGPGPRSRSACRAGRRARQLREASMSSWRSGIHSIRTMVASSDSRSFWYSRIVWLSCRSVSWALMPALLCRIT
jgi:hypothetical protein